MAYSSVLKLHHITKGLVLLMVIISTELGSNIGIYLATLIWLEIGYIIKIEKWLVAWFQASKCNKYGSKGSGKG